jgi:hypothetical protein
MGWPKGKPRKKKEPQPQEPYQAPQEDFAKAIPENEGAVVSERSVEEVMTSVSVLPSLMPSLCHPDSDPFTKWKTDQKHYAYRALNINKKNLSERTAQGWTPIVGAEFGDLILAKKPIADHQALLKHDEMKTKMQVTATKERFKEEAARSGYETFEEK